MAATQTMAIQMTMNASSGSADLSRVVNEFSKFIDKVASGAGRAEEAKAKAEAAAKEAEEKAKAAIEKVSSSIDGLFSSIKSGQSPLTSFVGEGARLVSSFGGIGPALGGVAAYARNLVSPINLATRAVTLLTEAYVEGSKEAVAYANAKTMTGNYVGLTTDQLQTKAVEIAGTQGTQARAAEAITSVVNTGRIGGDVVSEVAGATAEMNRVLGTSINEAVGNFVKLADEPSKASAKLNETYHYLSASTYERIVALEKQGKTEEAAALAQTTFANAMKQRTAEVVGNLGSLERGWLAVKSVAERAWDSMLNIGRPETTQKKIGDVDKKIAQLDALESGSGFAVNAGGAAFGRPKSKATRDSERAALEAEKANYVDIDRLARQSAYLNSQRVKENDAKIKTESEKKDQPTARPGTSGVGRAEDEGLRASIEAVREEYNAKARATADGLKNVESLRKRELIDDYAVIRQKKSLRLEDLKNQEEAIQKEQQLLGSKKGTAVERQQLVYRSKTVEQQREFVNSEADRSFAELDATSQNAVLKTSQQATEKLREQVRAQEEQNAVYGLTKEAVMELNIAQTQRQITELEATENVVPNYVQSLRERLQAEKDLLAVTKVADGRKTKDEEQKKTKDEDEKKKTKLADDIGGVFRDGFVNLLDGGGKDAIDKMGEALKKKLAASVADALYDASVKPAVEAFSGWLSGAFKGIFSGSGSSTGSSSGSGGNWFSSLLSGVLGIFGIASAKGNVFASPGLHAYANSVVSQPTFFPFANGIGLMGEAGPEAIMPLRRGADGRLGVSAPGGGGNAVPTIQFAPSNVFHIDARSDRGAVMADMQRLLAENNRGQMEQLKRVKVLPQ